MTEKQLDRLENKIDALDGRLDALNETLLRNTISLEIHEQRTRQLENRVEPIESHVKTVSVGLRLVGGIGFVLGLVLTIKELFF